MPKKISDIDIGSISLAGSASSEKVSAKLDYEQQISKVVSVFGEAQVEVEKEDRWSPEFGVSGGIKIKF